MEDQTITDTAPVEDGAQALPEQTEQQTAATETPAETEGAQALPEVDDELSNFAQSHGLELDSPSAIKAAKLARENQQGFHAQRHQEKLEQTLGQPAAVDTDNEIIQQLASGYQQLNAKLQVRDFNTRNNLTEEQSGEFAKYMAADTKKLELVRAGYLSLDEAYQLSGLGQANPSTLKSQGAKEALQSLATTQRAAGVRGSAVNPAPTTAKADPMTDAFLKS